MIVGVDEEIVKWSLDSDSEVEKRRLETPDG